MKIEIEVSDIVYALLEVLAREEEKQCKVYMGVKHVIETLIDHAQQGVYRPGSWERNWILEIFPEFEQFLEPGDPYGRPGCEAIFMRPRRSRRATLEDRSRAL